jgi:hypothetical protein
MDLSPNNIKNTDPPINRSDPYLFVCLYNPCYPRDGFTCLHVALAKSPTEACELMIADESLAKMLVKIDYFSIVELPCIKHDQNRDNVDECEQCNRLFNRTTKDNEDAVQRLLMHWGASKTMQRLAYTEKDESNQLIFTRSLNLAIKLARGNPLYYTGCTADEVTAYVESMPWCEDNDYCDDEIVTILQSE